MKDHKENHILNKKSLFLQSTFFAILMLYFIFIELTCRSENGKSFVVVVWAFIGAAEMWGGILFFFALTAFIWIVMTSTFIHSIYIAITGKPVAFIFLGSKLSKGDFVYKENDKDRKVIFIPSFTKSMGDYDNSFRHVYKRKYYMEDREKNLSDPQNLKMGKNVLTCIIQLIVIFLNMACLNAIVNYYHNHHSGHGSDNVSSVILLASLVAFIIIVYPLGLIILRSHTPDLDFEEERILPLPAFVKPEAILQGKIIESEIESETGQERDRDDQISYKQFAIQFDEHMKIDPPIYLAWGEKKIADGTILRAVGSYKRELIARKQYYDEIFSRLDLAKQTGTYIEFQLDRHLNPIPRFSDISPLPTDF